MIAQLVHVWVVLCQYGDDVTLLPNDESRLLLRGVPEINAVKLKRDKRRDSHVFHFKGSFIFISMRFRTHLEQLISKLQVVLLSDAAPCYLGNKNPAILPAHDGDAQRLRPFGDSDTSWLFYVWPETPKHTKWASTNKTKKIKSTHTHTHTCIYCHIQICI